MTQPAQPRTFVAPEGMTSKEEEDKLKAQFDSVAKGTEAEIPPELERDYRYAMRAIDYWKDQARLITNQMRRHAGNAQTVCVNGIPVAQRRVYKVEAHLVDEYWVDGYWPATGTKAAKS